MFSLKQEKPNDTLLPFYIFLNAMHLNLKAEGRFDMSNWLLPWIVLLQHKNIFKILARLFLLFMLRKKGMTTQFVIWQGINTIHQWEKWWEVYQYPGSCKLQCLAERSYLLKAMLVTSHLLKAMNKTSFQSSLRLHNLRMVLKLLQNHGFQTEYLYQ